METTLTKGSNGWEAKTYIDIGEAVEDSLHRSGLRRLCIHTSKGYNGGLRTSATVSLHMAGGMMSHAFGLGTGRGDYSKTIAQSPARCTDKAVREQHAQALGQADAILAEARAFYEAKEQQATVRNVVADEIARGAAPALATNQTIRELSGNS